ncbi:MULTISPECIES: helix-turn-helix domain-containing protein [unclassified Streptomyces]|uniref:helix-turn-helix domain-containing protein n=1 Tax=unclassified Streptomyces TaxID=2593676 RepID=UPI000DC78211|nr:MULTISPECIES: helix-turn-helix domain-containing protein [unclassified Streptomyces]AWZ03439.1 MarR family transcriptional regulator [Streptomyces sp. ICC4]AWZ11288.1 MarR family transcriptional regulator [Streptomyces sp. ICC1]
MPGGRLTQQERQRIAAGLADGLSYAEIARRLDRSTSTISREVARNGSPGGYRPQQAHRATVQRAQRGTPAPPCTAGAPAGAPGSAMEEEIIELAVRAGLPRMTARVHVDLLLSEDGRRTAAELTHRLKVSPASVSVSVNFLVQQGYVRRERDPQRRRDIYVVDDDAWYHSIVISSQQTRSSAQAAMAAAETLGLDTPVGQRLAKVGTFLERVVEDMLKSADRWRALLA